ncbi:hypothetical protein DsansV1_C06g0064461 [Dioscorea sansibarensis]
MVSSPPKAGPPNAGPIILSSTPNAKLFLVLSGKYYLFDASFMLRRGLITPYRGGLYHLKEYSKNLPRNARELFNL